jgi:hypothetical protein
VSHYVIDVHHRTHTDPVSGQARVFDTRRTVVTVEPGGPCTRPARIAVNGRTVTVACARAVPAGQQCPACRTTITVRHVQTTDLGPIVSITLAPSGRLKHLCTVCALPVDAVLAATNRHLLCQPSQTGRGRR